MRGLLPLPFAVDLLPAKERPSFFARLRGAFKRNNKVDAAWGFDFGHSCFKAVRLTFDTDGTLAVDECFHCHHADYDPKPKPEPEESDSVFSEENEEQISKVLNEPEVPGNPFTPKEEKTVMMNIDADAFKRYAIEAFLRKYEYRGESICVGYAPHDIYCDNIQVPQMTPDQTWSAVQLEMRNRLADGFLAFAYNYLVLGWSEDENNLVQQYLHLFATRNSSLEKVMTLLQEYGIEATHITPTIYANLNYAVELFGLPPVEQLPATNGTGAVEGGTSSVKWPMSGEFQPPEFRSILVCDMGTSGTDLTFYNLQEIRHFYIPVGGRDFTQAISKGLGVPLPLAEAIKRDFQRAEDMTKLADSLKPVARRLIDEIFLRLEHFRKSGGTFDKVVVMGGGFQLKGFAAYFRSLLEVLWKEKK